MTTTCHLYMVWNKTPSALPILALTSERARRYAYYRRHVNDIKNAQPRLADPSYLYHGLGLKLLEHAIEKGYEGVVVDHSNIGYITVNHRMIHEKDLFKIEIET